MIILKIRNKRKEQGITLIALVITIIVLLILAGVTINLTLKEGGIFSRAQLAAQNYANAQEKELAALEQFDNVINDTIDSLGQTSKISGVWSEKNKVNTPKIDGTGLIPVTLNATTNIANISSLEEKSKEIIKEVTSEEIKEEKWYSYTENDNRWANAKSKDGSLWVWVPRFAYKIDSENKKIDIVFLKGTSNISADENKDIIIKKVTDNDIKGRDLKEVFKEGIYIIHPAFCNGKNNNFSNGEWDAEIPGFWMAKFEAGYVGDANAPNTAIDSHINYTYTGNNINNYYGTGERQSNKKIKYPIFQANKPSMNYICIGDAFRLCQDMNDIGNPYGFSSNVDSHLTKNSEWGAVAYLTWSKYGTNGEKINVNNVKITNNENEIFSVTGYGNTNSNPQDLQSLLNGTYTEGIWTSTQGQQASTTYNITGIYDLVGAGGEYVATFAHTKDEVISQMGDDDFLLGNSKYITEMLTSNLCTDTVANNLQNYLEKRIAGDGIYEVFDKFEEGYGKSWLDGDFGFGVGTTCFNYRGRK